MLISYLFFCTPPLPPHSSCFLIGELKNRDFFYHIEGRWHMLQFKKWFFLIVRQKAQLCLVFSFSFSCQVWKSPMQMCEANQNASGFSCKTRKMYTVFTLNFLSEAFCSYWGGGGISASFTWGISQTLMRLLTFSVQPRHVPPKGNTRNQNKTTPN